ncbi:MAG: ABC transporter permease [Candidatus Thermoplasmatota archaeon]|jgi:peptide/nickel transport system permease protein|nr:ABC transporter permease [Candidatus Thermoplasmatota archaeon]WMT43748.1 MAG: ABC transporter permease [Cuniculiplasma divulgatum]
MVDDKDNGSSIRELRKKRLNFRLYQFKKQWKIFYRSAYGKVGFYIILIFAIIAILTPFLEVHRDALSYVAPSVDTTAMSLSVKSDIGIPAMINSTPVAVAASAISDLGSNMVYSVNSNGQVYGTSLGSATSLHSGANVNLFNASVSRNNRVLGIRVFPLQTITLAGVGVKDNYILIATAGGNLTLASLDWTGGSPGVGRLVASGISHVDLGLNLSSMPVSSSFPVDTSVFPSIPFSGAVFAIGSNDTGTYLVKIQDSPFSVMWTKSLPFASPSSMAFIGAFYSNSQVRHQTVVISDKNSLYGFYASNGTEIWKATEPYVFSGKYSVPASYQQSYSSYDSIFEVLSSGSGYYVDGFYISNGTAYQVYSSDHPISALSSSLGESGFPSSLLAITGNTAVILSSPGNVRGNASMITTYGGYLYDPVYVPSLNSYIISSQKGELYSLSATLGKNPFNWLGSVSKSPVNVSAATLLLDANTGQEAIAMVNATGAVFVYSANGVTLNPMPPTLHTPSGTMYLLGTNTEGNDVWSQFIASFQPDWIVGISVGLIGIAIALVLGMIIGYYRGFVSVALDTVTLVIYLIPGLALLIALTSVLSPSFFNIIWILSFLSWPFTTFTILGIIRSIKQRAFVEAAKVSGAGTMQILRRHMLPNVTPLLIYLTALNVSGAVGGIATLQFLGVAPLTILTWGAMLNPLENNFYLAASAPWWVIPPTVALTLFIMAFIFLSRGVDEVVNPRIRRR